MKITIAHDFICPWCWIALHQATELKLQFPDIEFDWVGYELFPDELEWPQWSAPEKTPNRPATPSRLDLAYVASGVTPSTVQRPPLMRSHNALEAVEYAKTLGVAEPLNERLYRALWEEGQEINNPDVIRSLAKGLVPDLGDLTEALSVRRFAGQIVKFDDDAYAAGIFNVPTFIINGERYAEQPTSVLRQAVIRAGQVCAR
jgi:predicted DsbA family dithiol-disulfide isomerase